MAIVLGSFIGAVLAFLAQMAIRGWQYKHEHWIGRAQAFVDLATETAEQATCYWCRAHKEDQSADTREREAEIIGKLARVDRLYPTIARHLEADENIKIKNAMAVFFDAVSGDEFGTPSKIDALTGGDRARRIHVSVAELIGSLHDAIDNALRHNFWGRAYW